MRPANASKYLPNLHYPEMPADQKWTHASFLRGVGAFGLPHLGKEKEDGSIKFTRGVSSQSQVSRGEVQPVIVNGVDCRYFLIELVLVCKVCDELILT